MDLPELGDFVPEPDVVEALENGLRFDPEIPEVVVEDSTQSEPSETSADEVVIDLRAEESNGAVAHSSSEE